MGLSPPPGGGGVPPKAGRGIRGQPYHSRRMESSAVPPADRRRSFSRWEIAPALLLALLAGASILYGASRPGTYDIGLAYSGGAEAFRSGHPEAVFTWVSTPFLAMLMALVTRVASADQAAMAYNLLNLALAVGLIAVVWAKLRVRVEPALWWVSLFAAVIFAPLSSSLWWKQFNLLALVLVVAGFALIRSHRSFEGETSPPVGRARQSLRAAHPLWGDFTGAALVGLSISIKPVVFLLPLLLLLRRDTRRAGLYSLAWIAAFQGLAQIFLAYRARDLATLWPRAALANFSVKSLPETNGWACAHENFSPTSTLCRLVGSAADWNLQRAAVFAIVVLFAVLLLRLLASGPGRSWDLFATACLLSPMFSPIAWTHYQLFLAPMMLLLAVELPRDRTALPRWVLLAVAYLLAELIWTPVGTLADIAGGSQLFGLRFLPIKEMVLTAAQFSQYFVLAAAGAWFLARESLRKSTGFAVLRV